MFNTKKAVLKSRHAFIIIVFYSVEIFAFCLFFGFFFTSLCFCLFVCLLACLWVAEHVFFFCFVVFARTFIIILYKSGWRLVKKVTQILRLLFSVRSWVGRLGSLVSQVWFGSVWFGGQRGWPFVTIFHFIFLPYFVYLSVWLSVWRLCSSFYIQHPRALCMCRVCVCVCVSCS